jgi:hypothetical protein
MPAHVIEIKRYQQHIRTDHQVLQKNAEIEMTLP